MQKYIHLLERIGMNEAEQTIYLTLLKNPYITLSEISQKSHYHRPTVYKCIRGFESDGLVERSYLDGKRYYYHVTSPEKLKEKIHQISQMADQILPELTALYQKTQDAPILSIKEGIDGIKSIHKDLVESVPKWGIYYRYSSPRREYDGRSFYVPENYFEMQKKKEIERIVITSASKKKFRLWNPNREVIAIPESFDTFDDNITKLIYANKVAIIDYDSQIGWVIENEWFARYEEKIFRLLAKLLKEQEIKKRPE